jgi:hypothetical protein
MLDPVLRLQHGEQNNTVAPPAGAAYGSSFCQPYSLIAHYLDFSLVVAFQLLAHLFLLALRPPGPLSPRDDGAGLSSALPLNSIMCIEAEYFSFEIIYLLAIQSYLAVSSKIRFKE